MCFGRTIATLKEGKVDSNDLKWGWIYISAPQRNNEKLYVIHVKMKMH